MTDVLVTGAGGFIGSALCPALRACGLSVTALVPPWHPPNPMEHVGDVLACDLSDEHALAEVVERLSPATIVHLAVNRRTTERPIHGVGIETVATLLDLAVATGAHLVHAGSASELSPSDQSPGATAGRPVGFHGVTKKAATDLVTAAVRSNRTDAVTLRPFLVYGPGEKPERFVPTAIRAALAGKPLPLTAQDFGRDYIYLDDVVHGFVTAVQGRLVHAEPVDLCTGTSTSNRELVAHVERAVGTSITIAAEPLAPRPWDRRRWTSDPSDCQALLGRVPLGLADGIERCVTYWRTK